MVGENSAELRSFPSESGIDGFLNRVGGLGGLVYLEDLGEGSLKFGFSNGDYFGSNGFYDGQMGIAFLNREGIELRNKIVLANLRLVPYVYKKRGLFGRGVPLEDFFQEGVFQLSRAIDSFEVDYGIKFSTYAYNRLNWSCGSSKLRELALVEGEHLTSDSALESKLL